MPAVANTTRRGPANGASFTEGSVAGHIAKLTGFMIMGFAAMTIAQLIEAVYLGILGVSELAAVAYTFPLVMGLNAAIRGIGVGASSVIARTIGTGNREYAGILVTHCLVLVLILVLICLLVFQTYAKSFFSTLGATGQVLDLTVSYTSIWFYGLPFFALSQVGTSLMRATGNAAIPGIVMTMGSVLQVVIGPFLIFGWLGLPKLGIEGAAWAFVISRFASFLMALYYFTVREQLIVLSVNRIFTSWREILYVGIPAMTTNLIGPVSIGIITRLLSGYGASVVAGFGVASRVDSLVTMVVISLASSTGPFIGQNWGAGKFDRVQAALKLCYLFCLGYGLVAFIFMALLGETLVSMINTDPQVLETAVAYLLIIPFSIGFMGMTNVANHCFNALGKPIPPLVISVNRLLILYVPLAIWLDSLFGYKGVFVATAIANIVMGTVAWYWNRITLRSEIATTELTDSLRAQG